MDSVGILLDSNQYHVKIIGIDSESPSQKVNIVDSIPVYIQATNTSNLPSQILLQNTNGNLYIGPNTDAVEIKTDVLSIPLILSTQGGEVLRIDPNTNIGIGKQNPVYPVSIGRDTAIYGIKYHKLNGTNSILWNYGDIEYVSGTGTGNHYIGFTLTWNNTAVLTVKETFRVTVKCHLSGSEIAYRNFTVFINPTDDDTNDLPNMSMVCDVNACVTEGFTNMLQSVNRESFNSVSIKCNWDSTCDNYKSYISVELFSSDKVGDMQFIGMSDI